MKEELIERYNLMLEETTKHNEIYSNSTHVLIFNKVTGMIKIKLITKVNNNLINN